MNRTQKKCFIVTAGTHLLLIVILFFGPGFLSSHNKADNLPVIEFVPMITTDKLVSGGGSPTANPPPAPPPQPAPQQQAQIIPPAPKPPPQVERVERQETVKDIKTIKTDPDAVEPKQRKPQVSKKLVSRSQVTKSNQKTTPVKTDSRSTADSSKEFTAAARRIRDGASSSTEIEMPGVGGGGPSYANYAQVVKSIYTQAWVAPDDVEDDDATARVSVIIARDGTVTSARIIQSSGNTTVDRSVQATLDRVTFIAPFPEGAKEGERAYKINFNLKAKRLLG